MKIEEVLGENQFGFRRGKGTRDTTGMLRIISERTFEIDEDICFCFTDWNMPFVTSSVQLVQRMPYQGSSGRVWRLQIGGKNIHTVKYADDLVLLAKEENVLQKMIDKLIEIGG